MTAADYMSRKDQQAGRTGSATSLLLLALVAIALFSIFSFLQTRATIRLEVRAQDPVRLQVFYSKKGQFSEADSKTVVALPDSGGQVAINIPASRATYLRLDPTGSAKPFEVCGLRSSRAPGRDYRPGHTNQLSWSANSTCMRLAPTSAASDPYIVMISGHAEASDARARAWRWAARISAAISVLLMATLAWRLDNRSSVLSLRSENLFRALSARAHWLSFVVMMVMGSLIAHALPPNGIPDEVAHASKVAKVSAGVLLSDSGAVPVVDVLSMYENMNGVVEPSVIDPGALTTALQKPLACMRAVRTLPTMADGYAPHLYAVPAIVLSASCALDTSFGTFLTVSRIVNLLIAAGLIAIGVRFAEFGKWSLVAVGLLPMTLAQVASISADSLTISLSLCFLGIVSGLYSGAISAKKVRYWLPALAMLLAFAKPGAAWVLIAFLFCRRAYAGNNRAFLISSAAVVIAPWLLHACWALLSSSAARPLAGVDPHSNLALLQNDPLKVAALGLNTFFGPHGEFIYKSTLGLLGWLDVPLSNWAYALGGAALTASLFANERSAGNSLIAKGVVFGVAAASVAMLSFPLYVFWTNPESGIVMGLQGRYFLPTLAFGLVWLAMRSRPVLRLAMVLLILAMPAMTIDAVRHVNDRYYIVGR